MKRLLTICGLLIGGALCMTGCVRYDRDLFVYYPGHHGWHDHDYDRYDWHDHQAPPPNHDWDDHDAGPRPHGGKPHGGKPDNHGGKPDNYGGKPDNHGGKPDNHGGKPDTDGGKPDGHSGGKPHGRDVVLEGGVPVMQFLVDAQRIPVTVTAIAPLPATDDARARYQVTGVTTGLVKTKVNRIVTYDRESGMMTLAK